MLELRPEQPGEIHVIRAVNEAAFPTSAEADLVDALREAGAHVLSFVAVNNNQVVGHILFSPVTLESSDGPIKILGLAPMAVQPERQRTGIGSRLVTEGLERCTALGHEIVVVLGHPSYYPRFGFQPAAQHGIASIYDVPDDTFMVKELRAGALSGCRGLAKYLPAFDDL